MKILVINAGSSSLKLQLFETGKNFKCLYKGTIERICKLEDYGKALAEGLNQILGTKVLKNLNQINAVGHRVVHGGEKYSNPVLITPAVLKEIKKLCELAPLHNPPNLAAILACKKTLKKPPQIAVFDTAFHQTMPKKAFIYGLPYDLYQKNQVRRYGFHGTSHKYVSEQTIKLLKKKNSKIVTCHLGNGASITAVLNGKSIDTSMGYTPLEGLPMGTRSGDIDPAIVYELIKIKKLKPDQLDEYLNKKSGLKGISGVSSDMRDLWTASKKNPRAKLALQIFCYKIAKYIGAYSAAMNGLDAITFTAGIGENAWYIRQEVCWYLSHLNVIMNRKNNLTNSILISAPKSKVKVYVIPTNEEKQIAIETTKIITK